MPVAKLGEYLNKLEDLVDLGHVARTSDLQRRAFRFEPVDHLPTIIYYPVPPEEWPNFNFVEVLDDMDKMLLQELQAVYMGAKLRDDRLYGIRANYGTGIIASMFGCEIRTFENALPLALPLGAGHVERILDSGVPDTRAGVVGRAFDTVAFYRETLKPYPRLAQVVGSMMLDIQGPFDNAHIVWGHDIFLALYDEPDKVMRLQQIMADTIMAVMKEHRRIDGQPLDEHDGASHHLGGLCIRLDSCVNLGGAQYREYCKPFEAYLLRDLGGWIHFCGRAHQWWQSLLDLPKLRGINPAQGEFYNVLEMYERCAAARVAVVGWGQPLSPACRDRIRTGMSRLTMAPSFDDAQRIKERLHCTGHADGG